MAVSQLGYLGIGVSNMDAWEAYATEVLGMEVSGRADDGTLYLRMDENHHRLALCPTGVSAMLVSRTFPSHTSAARPAAFQKYPQDTQYLISSRTFPSLAIY